MRGSTIGITALALTATITGFTATAGTPAAQYAVSLVAQDTYEYIHSDMLFTHDGHDRKWGPEHDLAQANIQMLMTGYGLVTTLDPFIYSSNTYYNVVGELVGTDNPDQIYIVGAHYDSTSWSGPCPGADDDASGVAAFLTVAQLVSQWESTATIRFIAFDREEQGLHGSTAYANTHVTEDIRGVVVCDMIAYNAVGSPMCRVWGREASLPLKNDVVAAVEDYTSFTCVDGGRRDSSDHVPFERVGIQACLLQESAVWENPHYHTAQDSVDTPNYIDYPYAVEITRGLMGWLVDTAGVRPDHPAGDLNCDYVIDFGDINPFVLALSDPVGYASSYPDCNYMNADINDDGKVDFQDINPFVDLLTGP